MVVADLWKTIHGVEKGNMTKRRFSLSLAILSIAMVTTLLIWNQIYGLPKSPLIQYDTASDIYVWLDENGNGIKDITERPMEGICGWAGFAAMPSEDNSWRYFQSWEHYCELDAAKTDRTGHRGNWFWGTRCEAIHLLILPPDGYQPTTPTAVHDCFAGFGLIKSDIPTKYTNITPEKYFARWFTQQYIISGIFGAIVILTCVTVVKYIRKGNPSANNQHST